MNVKKDYKDFREEFWKVLKDSSSIAILTHQNPDGDGFPATLALRTLLLEKGIKSDIVLEEEPPALYDFIRGKEIAKVFDDKMYYETAILVDCHEEDRVGKASPIVKQAKNIFTIDHHIENNVIKRAVNLILPECVSAGVIIFSLFEDDINGVSDKSKKYIADCIYTTILNDTDGYLNSNINENTFMTASKLMKFGLKPAEITEKFLLSKTVDEIKFIGEILAEIETYHNDKVLFMSSTLEMLEKKGLTQHATSKLTRYVKGVVGVYVIVYFSELKPNYWRLNLRSNVINVNKIAVKFGGGGHKNASGCRIAGDLQKIKSDVLKEIEKQL
jgi:phosphoesterase RecJ-like protein